MNLNQLKYFISVAEHQSFTKAANQFYISQTAITQQIQALENTVDTPLIDRTTRPISLTPSGKTFLIEAKSILRHMDTAIMRTREASKGLMGNIRIGYTKGYEQSNLPKRLRDFHKQYPNILITCYRNDTDMLASGIINKEYDIIFTWDSTDIRQESMLEIHDMETVPLYVAMHTRHPFARRENLTRQDLKGENILFMSPSSTGDSFGDAHYIDLYQKAGFQPNILLRTNDYESILMMVAAEEGISIIPEYCIGTLRSVNNITFRPLTGEEETEEVLAVWHKENVTPALQHFIDEL
jgi:DNA-binding transcriptional LysR family regulator